MEKDRRRERQVHDSDVTAGAGDCQTNHPAIRIGGELTVLGNATGGVGTAGVNASYHFLPDAPGIEPFVSGGMSFGSGAEYGLAGYTRASAGGGFNYWFGNGMALRLELKGRYDLDQDDHR